MMNKEDILAKSREEQKNSDERELQIRGKSAIPAFVGLGVIGVTLMILEAVFLDTTVLSRSIGLIIAGTVATQHWYLAFTLRKKLWFFMAVLFTLKTMLSILQVVDAFQAMM